MIRWLKNKIAMLSFAFGSVEKNALNQNGGVLTEKAGEERRVNQGTLADDLKQGIISQEVKDLRWRTYKVMKAAEGFSSSIIGYDKDGFPITNSKKKNKNIGLNKIKIDGFDTYSVQLVVDNSEITADSKTVINNDMIDMFDQCVINYDNNGEVLSATHGEITGEEYFATTKPTFPIIITRDSISKFDIEQYTKKMVVRSVSDTIKLLEFYVSKYPDEYNRTSRLFISDIKKAIIEPSKSTILQFNEVNFISNKTLGTYDLMEYKYKILSFDKIIDFNGHYVIKFLSEVIIDGGDIVNQYREEMLEERYKNKTEKK